VMRPPVPVPAIAARSRSCSAASLRNERRQDLGSRAPVGNRGSRVAAAAAGGGSAGSLRRLGRRRVRSPWDRGTGAGSSAQPRLRVDAAEAPASAASPASISASSVPTATVSPRHPGSSSRCPRRGRGPRCRPCRWRSRRAARRARRLALLLEPLQDRAFDDRLAELRHLDRVTRHRLRSRPSGVTTREPLDRGLDVGTCGRYASSRGGENGTA
jgi:hypothetical protein